MDEVKVTELRQNLPAYLAKVQRGLRVRVTSRGKVIAELGPPSASGAAADAARARLRGSVLKYVDPTAPVIAAKEWDVEK